MVPGATEATAVQMPASYTLKEHLAVTWAQLQSSMHPLPSMSFPL